MCNCVEHPVLLNISNNHSAFTSKLDKLDVGNWVVLMQCPECMQLYKVDGWDKYQISYAIKIPSSDNWESYDTESLIKEQMVKNRGGLSSHVCMWSGCDIHQVKGSAFCVHHLYAGGTRA